MLTGISTLGKSLEFKIGQYLDVSMAVSTEGVDCVNRSKPFTTNPTTEGNPVTKDEIIGFSVKGSLGPGLEINAGVEAKTPWVW